MGFVGFNERVKNIFFYFLLIYVSCKIDVDVLKR